MNRLWVRLSIIMSGFLISVFIIQYISIKLDQYGIAPQEGTFKDPTGTYMTTPTKETVANRLVEFMAFSIIVGIVGGILISRLISAPINNLANTAEKIGMGDLSARATIRGSTETKQLAATFNKMVDDVQKEQILRKNMMADVSHELRIPLTILSGNLRAVLDHVYTLDEVEVANLYGQTCHLIRLVNDLRELALAESNNLRLEKSPSDMSLIVAETLQAIDPLIQEKAIVIKNEIYNIREFEFDPGRIKQVWFNLISNALTHTPPGGEITFSSKSEPDCVRFSIQDTGEGIEANQLKEIFNRFYRADESRSRETGGTGLGLAIVKAFVEMHGGQVAAKSEGKNMGCTFEFTLPINHK
jgi:signal transduction histidine kinase